jgi:hypothetical protein
MKKSELEVGQKVFVPASLNDYWTGEGIVERVSENHDIAIVSMKTGKQVGISGGFAVSKLQPATGMQIVSLKRSTHRTGLKVYGKVLGESGKEYNVAYFRRPNFRGWICSCENFFFTMFAKKRNCKHLRFVRGQVGRFAASVK